MSRFTPAFDLTRGNERNQNANFVFPQQQLTSLLSLSHAGNFSTDGNESFPSDADSAASPAAFDPSMVLDAVSGSEEGSWLAAREDCWFFNRYMQSILRFAQETTGLPW